MSTTRCSAFTTTMRVIHWVHGDTTNSRSEAHPALTTSFTKLDIAVIRVANLTNRSEAALGNAAKLTTGHLELRVAINTTRQLS